MATAAAQAAGVPTTSQTSQISQITIHTSSGTWVSTSVHDETIRRVDGLAANPRLSAELQSTDRQTLEGYISALRTLGKTRAAQALEQNEQSVIVLTVHDDAAPGSTKWLLLANGDTILLDFDDGATFAFGTKWYGSFTRAAKNAQFAAVGVLVGPGGKVDQTPPAEPIVIL